MKTNEELNALKSEVENLNKKLAELTEEELKQISGGSVSKCAKPEYYCNNHDICPFRGTTGDCRRCSSYSNGFIEPVKRDVIFD